MDSCPLHLVVHGGALAPPTIHHLPLFIAARFSLGGDSRASFPETLLDSGRCAAFPSGLLPIQTHKHLWGWIHTGSYFLFLYAISLKDRAGEKSRRAFSPAAASVGNGVTVGTGSRPSGPTCRSGWVSPFCPGQPAL